MSIGSGFLHYDSHPDNFGKEFLITLYKYSCPSVTWKLEVIMGRNTVP